jgi:hypothetical protein
VQTDPAAEEEIPFLTLWGFVLRSSLRRRFDGPSIGFRLDSGGLSSCRRFRGDLELRGERPKPGSPAHGSQSPGWGTGSLEAHAVSAMSSSVSGGAWSGDADCADGTVTMSARRQCEARFELLPAETFADGFEAGDVSHWSDSIVD